jgi:hypothetical protein
MSMSNVPAKAQNGRSSPFNESGVGAWHGSDPVDQYMSNSRSSAARILSCSDLRLPTAGRGSLVI